MTDMRAQFEAWAETQRPSINLMRFDDRDVYHYQNAQDAWLAYQAASAALGAEVERLREALGKIAEMTEHVQYGPENLINSVAMCALSPASEGTKPRPRASVRGSR